MYHGSVQDIPRSGRSGGLATATDRIKQTVERNTMSRKWVVGMHDEPPPPPPPAPPPPPREVGRGEIMRLTQELRQSIHARSCTGRGEKSILRKAFKDIDADNSGTIEMPEFLRALERFGLHTSTTGLKGGRGGVDDIAVRALFESFDADGNGYLDYAEFEEKLLQPERPAPPPQIRTKPRVRGDGTGFNG